jgi:hypothetical protein
VELALCVASSQGHFSAYLWWPTALYCAGTWTCTLTARLELHSEEGLRVLQSGFRVKRHETTSLHSKYQLHII